MCDVLRPVLYTLEFMSLWWSQEWPGVPFLEFSEISAVLRLVQALCLCRQLFREDAPELLRLGLAD